MVLAEVERVEVQPRRLDLGALGHLVAHRDEDVRDPLADLGDRVAGAAGGAVERQGDVDGLLGQHPLVALGLQHRPPGVEGLLHPDPRGVDALARLGALGAGKEPSSRRASSTGARSPRWAGRTAARAARSGAASNARTAASTAASRTAGSNTSDRPVTVLSLMVRRS